MSATTVILTNTFSLDQINWMHHALDGRKVEPLIYKLTAKEAREVLMEAHAIIVAIDSPVMCSELKQVLNMQDSIPYQPQRLNYTTEEIIVVHRTAQFRYEFFHVIL